MRLNRRALLQTGGCALLSGLSSFPSPARAEGVTEEQLKVLVPDERDLSGFVRVRQGEVARFVRVRPEGENPRPPTYSREERRWVPTLSPAMVLDDEVWLNVDQTKRDVGYRYGRTGIVSRILRGLYSADGMYRLVMIVMLCDSVETARGQLEHVREGSSGVWERGTFGRPDQIGDESWVLGEIGSSHIYLSYRCGKVVVDLRGMLSRLAIQNQVQASFPPASVEAIAHQILLRAARRADLTGIPARSAAVLVNGKPLPTGVALAVDDRVYVPVNEFATLAGLQSKWNAETGNLTLGGKTRKTVALAAGSASATVAGTTVASLKTPVLKEGNAPVMVLQDLLPLVQGRITSREGDTLQVTV